MTCFIVVNFVVIADNADVRDDNAVYLVNVVVLPVKAPRFKKI